MNTFSLEGFEKFYEHSAIRDLREVYTRNTSITANHTVERLAKDLTAISDFSVQENGCSMILGIESRVKKETSIFKKLYRRCVERNGSQGLTQKILTEMFEQVHDISGVRFACPYYDQIESVVNLIVRPALSDLGYAVDLSEDPLLKDQNRLDVGDNAGYRDYCFFVKVPTLVDIFGNSELCLCEVQVRTELQHVWAMRSHDLLYKSEPTLLSFDQIREDMRQVSNSLRVADQFLVSIRDRLTANEGLNEMS